MVTKLHRRMGAMIRENVSAALSGDHHIRISSFWYGLGNMLPDLSWLPVTHPHFASRSFPYIYKKLVLSLTKHRRHAFDQYLISPVFSLRLGIVSHYLCDFFCAAHQGDGINGAKRHLNYEHEMRDFFYDHKSEIEALCRFEPETDAKATRPADPDYLFSVFAQWHAYYRDTQSSFLEGFTSSDEPIEDLAEVFVTDIRTAIACCTCVICSFVTPVAVTCRIE